MGIARFRAPISRLRGLVDGEKADLDRLAFVAAVVLAGATFWFAARPPMTDLPQHAGQVAVWRDLLLGTSKWQSLVYINYFTPYLVGYSLALVLSFVLPVSAALKLILTLAYYGFVLACVALRRRFGGDRRLDWFFIPGFFGYAYAWGFYTFLVAAPLGVLFILLAHRYADRPTPVLGASLFLADLVLFFSHGLTFLFANCIGGMFLLLKCRELARLLSAVLPYVAAGLCCVVYALVRLRVETGSVGELNIIIWRWDLSRLSFFIYSMASPMALVVADWRLGALVLLVVAAPLILGARLNRQDPTAFVPFAVTLLVWAVVPAAAMNTWSLYQRFAMFLLPSYAFIFRPGASVDRGILSRLWLPVLCWTVLAMHTGRLMAFAKESTTFEEVLAATQPSHRALGLIFEPGSTATRNFGVYLNFPLWYQAERRGFVDFNAAGFVPQIVRYRFDRAPAAFMTPTWSWQSPTDFDWSRDGAQIYRYFFVRRSIPLPQGYFPSGRCAPVLLKSAGPWSVFENVSCHLPDD
jgi:hypothetical protein